jgi:hypothetical protein
MAPGAGTAGKGGEGGASARRGLTWNGECPGGGRRQAPGGGRQGSGEGGTSARRWTWNCVTTRVTPGTLQAVCSISRATCAATSPQEDLTRRVDRGSASPLTGGRLRVPGRCRRSRSPQGSATGSGATAGSGRLSRCAVGNGYQAIHSARRHRGKLPTGAPYRRTDQAEQGLGIDMADADKFGPRATSPDIDGVEAQATRTSRPYR